jgi:hypothetical protein
MLHSYTYELPIVQAFVTYEMKCYIATHMYLPIVQAFATYEMKCYIATRMYYLCRYVWYRRLLQKYVVLRE